MAAEQVNSKAKTPRLALIWPLIAAIDRPAKFPCGLRNAVIADTYDVRKAPLLLAARLATGDAFTGDGFSGSGFCPKCGDRFRRLRKFGREKETTTKQKGKYAVRGIESAFWGVLGKYPELREGKSGKQFCSFSCAVAVGQDKNGDVSQWINAICFGETAERIAETAQKGDRIYCEGNLTLATWEGSVYLTEQG